MLKRLQLALPLLTQARQVVFLLGVLWIPNFLEAQKNPSRTFTNLQGVSFEGRLKAVGQNKATLVLENGKDYTVAIASFSPEDQQYIQRWYAANPNTFIPAPVKSNISLDRINQLIGHKMFIDGYLWENPVTLVARRLGWPRESQTPYSSSYRAYPGKDYRLLGARPYSVALYGTEEKTSGVSIVFANKGDFFRAAGSGEKHFIQGKLAPNSEVGLRMAMDHDADTISTIITKALGQPKRQNIGIGNTRQNVYRWDWSGHAFLLANVKSEYVGLSIQPIEYADKHGNTKRVPDSVVRKRSLENIQRRSNKDVVITNIPMVNQGPKGYCVPATAERCMRYLGIPADMYLLAMAGQTSVRAGTSPALLLESVGREIKRKGRSFKIWKGKLNISELARYIDKGVPVMWGLYSTRDFNQIASMRTMERRTTDSWSSYKSKVRKESLSNKLPIDRRTSHVVIIIGYNRDTGEIAFSDSWGDQFRERWISLKEAQQVSQDMFYVVDL